MIITLSPAKMMKFGTLQQNVPMTEPLFQNERDEVIKLLQQLSYDDMMKLMHINRKLADTVFPQIQSFFSPTVRKAAACVAYNGMAYKGLDCNTFTKKDVNFAQQHLLITSAVYGFLRPLDEVRPYRLEMQAELSNPLGNNMYAYWQDKLTQYLSRRLQSDDNVWLNLSSDEYVKVICRQNLPKDVIIITPRFLQINHDGGYRQVIVHTKKARGLMARFVIQNRLTNIDDLQAFNLEGYMYLPQLSKKNEPTFVR